MAGKKNYLPDDFPCIDKNFTPEPGTDPFLPVAVILMNKPAGWTSFDVVGYVRNRIKIKKVGHAGTLDPLATGLVICCCGRANKTISRSQEEAKTYLDTICVGDSTPSYDAATEQEMDAGGERDHPAQTEKKLIE